MRSSTTACLLVLGFLAGTSPATAEEQVLRFRLVTQRVGEAVDLPAIGGHQVVVGQHMGVAVFEDGRIAHKSFVDVSDDTEQGGTFYGYSTYTFQNGDSLTLRYTGDWGAKGLRGEYTLLSGTGRYANATGTGSFTGADEPWEDAYLLEGSFRLNVPTQ